MGKSLVTTGRMVMMRSIGYEWDKEKKKKSLGLLKKTSTQNIARLRLSCKSSIIHMMNTDNHTYCIIPNQPENTGICIALLHTILRTIAPPRCIAQRRPVCFRPYTKLLSFTTLPLFVSTAIKKFNKNIEVQISLNEPLPYISSFHNSQSFLIAIATNSSTLDAVGERALPSGMRCQKLSL